MRLKIIGKGLVPVNYEVEIDGELRKDVVSVNIKMAVGKANTAVIEFQLEDIEVEVQEK